MERDEGTKKEGTRNTGKRKGRKVESVRRRREVRRLMAGEMRKRKLRKPAAGWSLRGGREGIKKRRKEEKQG